MSKQIIRIRSIHEAADFIEAPLCTDWSPTIHNSIVFWAGRNHVEVEDVDVDVHWLNDSIENYAYSLCESIENEKAWFEMYDEDTIHCPVDETFQREYYTNKRQISDPHLLAAMYVRANKDGFLYDNVDSKIDRRIVVTNKSNGNSFVFSDLDDYSMYHVFLKLWERCSKIKHAEGVEAMLSKFIE